jgi:hypothetical protein
VNSFKLFVTYGSGSNLGRAYSVVTGKDHAECRKHVEHVTKGKFAFTYTESEFAGQPEKYGLVEVPLQPQVLPRAD